MDNLKRFKVLIEKRGKRQWLIIRQDVDGHVRAPKGWAILRMTEVL